MYKENPKTKGSGIVCCIPQTGTCPNNCEDCFFQGGRSYLEPLADNLPNMPSPDNVIYDGSVVRVNDGNDSNVDRKKVITAVQCYPRRFYNTAIPHSIGEFDAPVVLTLNPGGMTDKGFHRLNDPMPANLMFVRFRTNIWNLDLAKEAVDLYTGHGVPVVLTFMAYFEQAKNIPDLELRGYVFRKRTLNSYYAITTEAWDEVMAVHRFNKLVHSCGKVEGEKGDTKCRFCGNCLREYFATMERMREVSPK